ncbi:hypothetical protein WICANDRAFT_94178, partial [Wickerhamomyces anomalus NRRL Y-366-8]
MNTTTLTHPHLPIFQIHTLKTPPWLCKKKINLLFRAQWSIPMKIEMASTKSMELYSAINNNLASEKHGQTRTAKETRWSNEEYVSSPNKQLCTYATI